MWWPPARIQYRYGHRYLEVLPGTCSLSQEITQRVIIFAAAGVMSDELACDALELEQSGERTYVLAYVYQLHVSMRVPCLYASSSAVRLASARSRHAPATLISHPGFGVQHECRNVSTTRCETRFGSPCACNVQVLKRGARHVGSPCACTFSLETWRTAG